MFPPAAGRLILLQFPIKARVHLYISPHLDFHHCIHSFLAIPSHVPSDHLFSLHTCLPHFLSCMDHPFQQQYFSSHSWSHFFSFHRRVLTLFAPDWLNDSSSSTILVLWPDNDLQYQIGVKKSKVTSIGPPCMIIVIIDAKVYCTWSEQEKSCNHSGPGYNSCSSWWMWPRMPGMVRWKYQEHWSKKPEVNWSCCYVLYHRRHHWMKIMRWNDEGKEPDDTINRRARHPPELVHGLFLLYQT